MLTQACPVGTSGRDDHPDPLPLLMFVLLMGLVVNGCASRGEGNGTWLGQLIQDCSIDSRARGLQYHHPRLSITARVLGAVTTPFKYLGVSGWTDLGLRAQVVGRVYQDSAWSTDGFTTIDMEIHQLEIMTAESGCRYEKRPTDPVAYIRIEIKPWVRSPAMAGVRENSLMRISGRLKVDHDDDFFEIHPEREGDITVLSGD